MKFARQTVLLFKAEVTPGVDAAPTNVANAVLAFNARLTPMDGQDAERRPVVPYYRGPQKFPTALRQRLTFETELTGNTARGTAPAWSALMRACGFAEVVVAATSVTYNPVSTGFISGTAWFYIDGALHKLTYARGTAKLKLSVHGIPMIEWDFMGLYADPTDAALVVPTLTGYQDPQVSNFTQTPTFTINGFAAVMSSFELDVGNKLLYREKVNARSVEITDRTPAISATVEAEALASLNPFTLARNQTAFAVNLVHGLGAGDIVTINATNCRMNRPTGYDEQDDLLNWPLSISPLPTVGNDDFTIALT